MTTSPDAADFAGIVGAETQACDNLEAIDHQIAALHERVKSTSPRFAALIPHYRADIDALLDLRLWLTGAIAS
jgi:hypothetical protein